MPNQPRPRHRHSRAQVRSQHLRARQRAWREFRRWYDPDGAMAAYIGPEREVYRLTVDRKSCRCVYCSHRRTTYGPPLGECRQRDGERVAEAEALADAET